MSPARVPVTPTLGNILIIHSFKENRKIELTTLTRV